MDSPQTNQQDYVIFFKETVYGKATHKRTEDPSMFELLAWDDEVMGKNSFKKNGKFNETSTAYVNMIGKRPWTSYSKENYVDFTEKCIYADSKVLAKIENYITQKYPYEQMEKKQLKKNMKKEYGKSLKKIPTYVSFEGIKTIQSQEGKKYSNLKSNSQNAKHKKHIPQNDKKVLSKTQYNAKLYRSYKQIPSQLKESPQKEPDIPISPGLTSRQRFIKKFKYTTRWIPNSSFTTYFGKPPFYNYGRGNINPTKGGLIYGSYLFSHNVYPHRGNSPNYLQSYPMALKKAQSQGVLIPVQPKTFVTAGEDNTKALTDSTTHNYRNKIAAYINQFYDLAIEIPNLNQLTQTTPSPQPMRKKN